MKKILMAALVLTTLSTGRAYAGDPEECLLPKKPRAAAQAAVQDKQRCQSGPCGVFAVRG